MARRVVVTGLGILSPNGNSVQEAWENTKNGVNGIGPLTKAGAEGLPVHFAGELKNLDVLDHLEKKEARRLDEYAPVSYTHLFRTFPSWTWRCRKNLM